MVKEDNVTDSDVREINDGMILKGYDSGTSLRRPLSLQRSDEDSYYTDIRRLR